VLEELEATIGFLIAPIDSKIWPAFWGLIAT